jgi:hypothetical protein
MGQGLDDGVQLWGTGEALLPEMPDPARQEALESAHGFAGTLTVGSSPIHVGTPFCRMSSLCDGDAVQNAVEPAIAAAVQTVAHAAGGRSLEWRGSGVREILSIVVDCPW